MIGLVDYSLQTSTSTRLTPPNLEIMKLATYYKLEENTFCNLVSLNETELSSYDKIYFFCEEEIIPQIPRAFLAANNIIYGGTSFTKGTYVPFENSIIDFTIPKPSIYKQFLKTKYDEGIKSKIISHILDDSYYRMYAGKELLPIPPIQKQKRLFIYDVDFFYDGWQDIIDDISDRNPSSIIRIHPIICQTLSDYFSVRGHSKIARENEIILDIDIPLEEVHYMFKNYKNLFLADITQSSNVCITLGGNFVSNAQYFKDFIYKINLLYCFWSQSIPIKLRYTPPRVGFNDPLEPLSRLMTVWSRNIKNSKNIEERLGKNIKKKPTPQSKSRDLLLKFYPTAASLFTQTYSELSARRLWRI